MGKGRPWSMELLIYTQSPKAVSITPANFAGPDVPSRGAFCKISPVVSWGLRPIDSSEFNF